MNRANILIVDDNPSLATTTALILNLKGYDVATASDGLEAIQKVETHPYDIILMDIKMPHLNGVEACQRILYLRPGVVVVMITAYAVEELVQQAKASGAQYVLFKPLDIDKLISIIQTICSQKMQDTS
ncbi:MAG: response regulator [Anaerolineales bacterium]|nr:response regulator [Anaerolineales bacterium]